MPPPTGYLITPSSQQPIRSANDTAEFRRNYGANEFVNGLYALDSGWTGQGVTVGVIDDGYNRASGTIDAARISPLSRSFGSVTRGGVTTSRPASDIGDAQSSVHGSPVANIIGASRDGAGTQGYAPSVSVAVLNVNDFNYDTGIGSNGGTVIQAIDYATANSIRVLNLSMSSSTNRSDPSLRDAVTRYTAIRGLVVNSAGNSALPDPNWAVNVNAANRDSWLFVVGLSDGILGPYALDSRSNQAGIVADRTVAAPWSNVTQDASGTNVVFSGTSSAAPTVTALAATILSKWPQLTGQDAGNIILNTARDIGAPGTDPVFGRGLVDFKAALSPINPTLTNGIQSNSAGIRPYVETPVSASVMVVPPPVGTDGLVKALADVTVLDAYGRDFTGSLGGLVLQPQAASGHWLRNRLAQMGAGGSVRAGNVSTSATLGFATVRYGNGANDVATVATSGLVEQRFGSTSVRLAFNAADSLQSDVMGLAPFADGTLAYAPQAGTTAGVETNLGKARIGLTVGTGSVNGASASTATVSLTTGRTTVRASYVDETGSIMGVKSYGALALGRGATTAFVEAHQSLAIGGGWDLEGYSSVGVTRLKIDAASLVTGATPLVGTRLGLQASGPAFGGTLSFGIAQPLTIESGTARLTLGTGYDLATTSLTFGDRFASLASSERRLQLTTGFTRFGERSALRLGAITDAVTGEVRALGAWSSRF